MVISALELLWFVWGEADTSDPTKNASTKSPFMWGVLRYLPSSLEWEEYTHTKYEQFNQDVPLVNVMMPHVLPKNLPGKPDIIFISVFPLVGMLKCSL